MTKSHKCIESKNSLIQPVTFREIEMGFYKIIIKVQYSFKTEVFERRFTSASEAMQSYHNDKLRALFTSILFEPHENS